MSKYERVLERAKRAQARMLRGIVAAKVREFNRAQRAGQRKHRQSHPVKEARAIRSLMHEMTYAALHGHGSGSH